MIRLEMANEHTRLHSTLCMQCPHGSTGCCASPPGVDWADIGRIVGLGEREWLLEQIATGRLHRGARGLLIERVTNREANAGVWPTKCVYHGPQGCTIQPEQRSATCNYYICDDAFAVGGEQQGDSDAVQGREIHAILMALYGRWDIALGERIATCYSNGAPWDGPFLDWVGTEYARLVRGARRDLAQLR